MNGSGGALGAILLLVLMIAGVLLGTHKLWINPEEYWQAHRRRIEAGRSWMSNTLMTFIPLDPIGFVNHRGRYLGYSRLWWGFCLASLLCLLILEMAGALPLK